MKPFFLLNHIHGLLLLSLSSHETVLSTQPHHQQHTQGPSGFFILERYKIMQSQTVRQRKPKNNYELIQARSRNQIPTYRVRLHNKRLQVFTHTRCIVLYDSYIQCQSPPRISQIFFSQKLVSRASRRVHFICSEEQSSLLHQTLLIVVTHQQ